MKQKFNYSIRWFLFLPGAIIAYTLVLIIGYYIIKLYDFLWAYSFSFFISLFPPMAHILKSTDSTFWYKYISRPIGELLAAYYYMSVGSAIAPSNSRAVKWILFMLLVVYCGMSIFYIFNLYNTSVVIIIGAFMGGIMGFSSKSED